jgi:hypothetical protein
MLVKRPWNAQHAPQAGPLFRKQLTKTTCRFSSISGEAQPHEQLNAATTMQLENYCKRRHAADLLENAHFKLIHLR